MECVCIKSEHGGDWYTIERAVHEGKSWLRQDGPNAFSCMYSGRVSDADVEGDAEQMLALADAIEGAYSQEFKRCAVTPSNDGFDLWSPRNSRERGHITADEAARLVDSIRAVCK